MRHGRQKQTTRRRAVAAARRRCTCPARRLVLNVARLDLDGLAHDGVDHGVIAHGHGHAVDLGRPHDDLEQAAAVARCKLVDAHL